MSDDVIYKAAPDPSARHPKLTPEQKQQVFIEFVLRLPRWSFETKDNLELAVDLLAVAAAKPGCDVELRYACQANLLQTWSVLRFLHRQGLLTLYRDIYYARRDAVDELLYRLHNNGVGSWVEPQPIDPHAEARQEAKGKLKAALKTAGYRREGDVRLRVVK